MTNIAFDQARADRISAALLGSSVGAFHDAVALAAGLTPSAAAVSALPFPADFHIDATTFATRSANSATVRATGGGESHELKLIAVAGVWKLDSTGSNEQLTKAR